jgi:hypothetical protein
LDGALEGSDLMPSSKPSQSEELPGVLKNALSLSVVFVLNALEIDAFNENPSGKSTVFN